MLLEWDFLLLAEPLERESTVLTNQWSWKTLLDLKVDSFWQTRRINWLACKNNLQNGMKMPHLQQSKKL